MTTKQILLAIWLIAAVSILVVCVCLVESAHADGPAPPPAPYCATCHSEHASRWQSSSHAKAFSDQVFLSSWNAANQATNCLACHTTGFDAKTGKYAQEGVSCQACHVAGPQGHPGGSISKPSSVETCSGCHTETCQEWNNSLHKQIGIDCLSCHAVHSSEKLVAEPNTVICANCHKQQLQDATHRTHAAHQLNCLDCHMYTYPHQETPGRLVSTSHGFAVNARDCTSCHSGAPHTGTEFKVANAHALRLDCALCHAPVGVSTTTRTMRDIAQPATSVECRNCHTPGGGKVDLVSLGYTGQQVSRLSGADIPSIKAEQASVLSPEPKKSWDWLFWLGAAASVFWIFERAVARRLKAQ